MMDSERKIVFSFDGTIDELNDNSNIIYQGPKMETKYKTYYANQQISYREIPKILQCNHNKRYSDKMLGFLITVDYQGQFVVAPDISDEDVEQLIMYQLPLIAI